MTRREFLTTAAVAGTGVWLGASALAQSNSAPAAGATRKKRYALVGAGGRSRMYREAVLKTYAQHHEMVGFCDLNLGRLKLAQAKAREIAGVEVPIFEAKDFLTGW
jgi:hypothetical protein